MAAMAALGRPAPDVVGDLVEQIGPASTGLAPERTLVRGLFSGGTLCYESLVVLADVLGHGSHPDPAAAL